MVWFEVSSETVNSAGISTPDRNIGFAWRFECRDVSAITPSHPCIRSKARFSPSAHLEFVGNAVRQHFRIPEDTVWLGREADCEVPFNASDTMVSRKHPQIRMEGGNFCLIDNKSFNGTLVNDQRISAPTPLYDGDEIQLGVGGPLLKFVSPNRKPPKGASLAGQRSLGLGQLTDLEPKVSASKTGRLYHR